MAAELKQIRPAYFFVAAEQPQLFDDNASAANEILLSNYRVFRRDLNGTWYMRSEKD